MIHHLHYQGNQEKLMKILNMCLSYRVYFKSGNPEHPGDKFFNTTVDLQPYVQPKKNVNYIKDSDGFYTVANFSHDTGIAEAFIDKALGPISTVRLKIHSKSEAWIILNEV
jgi:alpha-1,3-mannosylglycoprotein beta-1,4-N-acetylglucosaminyltransferase A/B